MGDLNSIPELGRSPGEGKGYPTPVFWPGNSMSCIVNGVTMSPTQMSDFTHSLRAYSCHQRAEVGYISKTVQLTEEIRSSHLEFLTQQRLRRKGRGDTGCGTCSSNRFRNNCTLSFPGSSVIESACQCRRHGFDPWSRNIPYAKELLLSPCATQLLSLCYRALALQLLKPMCPKARAP